MNLIKKGESIQRVSIGIMFVTLVSKTIGFLRELVFSYYYGTTDVADAYIFSLTVSTIIFGFIGTGITTSFIPVYTTVKERNGIEKADRFTSNLVNIYIVLCIVIIAISLPNTKLLVSILAGGFDEKTAMISSYLCKFSILTIIATGLIGLYSGLLQINKHYMIPASVGFPLNIILIISIFISSKNGYLYLGLGNLLAVYSELIYLLPGLKKIKYKYTLHLNPKDEYLKTILEMAVPIILSSSVNQINVLIDKSLASSINGGVSTLNYAHTIISIVNDVVTASFITVIYPKITNAFVKNDYSSVSKIFYETLISLMYFLIPVAVLFVICSYDIVNFFYGRGAFDNNSIMICSNILKYYAIGIPFVGIRQLLIRIFYANKDTKTPVINGAIAVGVNITLNYPLKSIFGIGGLALATSLSGVVADILLWTAMKKNIKLAIRTQYKIDFVKIASISIILGAITYLLSVYLDVNVYTKMILITIVNCVLYIGLLVILNVGSVRK